ncbi:MAG: pilin [Patescibacteria group bacterium]|nr:pilin [Patescibacteria group bacterium]
MPEKMFKNKLLKSIFAVSVWLSLCPPTAFAAGILPTENGQKTGTCTSPNGCGNYSLNDILQVAVNVSNWILGSIGAIALLFFVYGGFVFILSGGNEEKVREGKTILMNAIIGLVIVFASYLIIQFSAGLLGANVAPGLKIKI